MGLLTDPIVDIDEARKALRAAARAVENALGDPKFRNYGAACDAENHIEQALEHLDYYPTFGDGDV